MREPAPPRVSPPQHEPVIKVGLILEEDQISSVSYSADSISLNGGKSFLNSGSISIAGTNFLSLSDSMNGSGMKEIVIEPASKQPLTAKAGIKLNPVIAGRNFHWKKQIEAIYPGKIVFNNKSNQIEAVNEVAFEDYLACVATSEM